ncbi:MAG: methyltransferase domain-containing protein [Sphingobacteriales bacterium]|uniref:methyltransferase domain-containing protein n=1 Tax=Hydrotalea flava TaxID=714549 RepID=UPI00082EE06B|nr:methyltransferase domain-containing protein [Hydrotalea flava]RTL48575.1 MAG: methyltransferase domain-containing protein [Sphingobacteriales bacterium]
MNLRNRSYQNELLDADDIPFEDIRVNIQELNFINTWLGGHAITIAGFKKIAANRKQLTVCEIGCGGGDNLMAIANYCKKKHISLAVIGIDKNSSCIEVARQLHGNRISAQWIVSDYATVHFDEKPDIIFSSLFCHHFTETELLFQLQWMQQNSRLGFFVNDLHRHYMAYYFIQWLTGLCSKSYLVKHDAPLSVARGFKKMEWIVLLQTAGIQHYTIVWKWAFRYLMIATNGNKY